MRCVGQQHSHSALVAAVVIAMVLGVGMVGASEAGAVQVLNGFELRNASVPVEGILPGGPPRDGIPALDHPKPLPAGQDPWHDDEMVIGILLEGEARAYPIAVLNWHELVNDTVNGRALLVSYCPLCGTGMVFDRTVGGRTRTFGVSGLLYQSDLLLYDRETESLWSQIASEAVTGPASGSRLRLLRSQQMSWANWKREHPETTVLGPDTGYARDYGRSPYGDYATSGALYFPAPVDPRYHPKMPTLGVRIPAGPARSYPAVELGNAGGRVEEEFEGHPILVSYEREAQTFDVEISPEVEVIEGYWFAWSAFHPNASVFTAGERPGERRISRRETTQ